MRKIVIDVSLVASGILAASAFLWFWSGGGEGSDRSENQGQASGPRKGRGGLAPIRARSVDEPTRPPLEMSSRDDVVVLRDIVKDKALNLGELENDQEWEQTAVALHDPAYVRDARVTCGRTWENHIERVCNYQIETVIDGTLDEPEVVYARAIASDVETADSAGCRGFIACIAGSRVGSKVPLPSTRLGEMVALRESLQSAHLPDEMYDPTYINNSIVFYEDQIDSVEAHLARNPDDTKAIRALHLYQSKIDHLTNFWLPELEKMVDE